MWDADARGGVRVEGRHHRVVGAKRGPAPAHDVGIWLGAYKPRMLAPHRAGGPTAGCRRWATSRPGDLARGNEVVDEAAVAAGRSPEDVRRLLNVNGSFSAGRGVRSPARPSSGPRSSPGWRSPTG